MTEQPPVPPFPPFQPVQPGAPYPPVGQPGAPYPPVGQPGVPYPPAAQPGAPYPPGAVPFQASATPARSGSGAGVVFGIAAAIVVVVALVVGVLVLRGGSESSEGAGPGKKAAGGVAEACAGVTKSTGGAGSEGAASDLVGREAPPLSGTNCMDGKPTSLAGTAGKPTLIVFWAHWCPHCQRELPVIERLYERHRDEWNVFTVGTAIGANPASPEFSTPAEFIETTGMTMPTILDPTGEMSAEYNLEGFPQLYFVDADGKVVEVESGELPEKAIEDEMEKLG